MVGKLKNKQSGTIKKQCNQWLFLLAIYFVLQPANSILYKDVLVLLCLFPSLTFIVYIQIIILISLIYHEIILKTNNCLCIYGKIIKLEINLKNKSNPHKILKTKLSYLYRVDYVDYIIWINCKLNFTSKVILNWNWYEMFAHLFAVTSYRYVYYPYTYFMLL